MATVSFSEIACWKNCRRKWQFAYKHRLRPIRQETHITLGTLCHAGIESWLKHEEIGTGVIAAAKKFSKNRFVEELEDLSEQVALAMDIVGNYVATKTRPQSAMTEIKWKVSIPGTKNHLVGIFDALAMYNGQLWIVEWKFPKTFKETSQVEMSTQLALYRWAAAELGYNVMGILYNQILQKLPAIPEMNKNGTTSRKEIYTDWNTFANTIESRGEDPDNYLDMKEKLQDKEFSRQYRIYYSPAQINEVLRELQDVSRDLATTKPRIYTCENFITCASCQFRDVCLEMARGRDTTDLIENTFYRDEK